VTGFDTTQPWTEAAGLVEQVLSEICDTLVAGEVVKLSSLGIFVVRSKAERQPQSQDRGQGAD
jgi:integration host factor subunit alpha